jgi:esterase/lipase superfamily enzyme
MYIYSAESVTLTLVVESSDELIFSVWRVDLLDNIAQRIAKEVVHGPTEKKLHFPDIGRHWPPILHWRIAFKPGHPRTGRVDLRLTQERPDEVLEQLGLVASEPENDLVRGSLVSQWMRTMPMFMMSPLELDKWIAKTVDEAEAIDKVSADASGQIDVKGSTGGVVREWARGPLVPRDAPQPRRKSIRKSLERRTWFGTNRKPVPGLPIDEPFTSERGDVVYHGYCDVFIPESHRIGSLGSAWWKRLFIGDDRVTLRGAKLLAEQTFWRQLVKACRRVPEDERQAVVYIHGYNTSFKEAARRAAQLGADLEIRGAMGFFSWPSGGTKRDYIPDTAAVEASEAQIADFLAGFATQSGSERVHIIAHSMGNRGLLRAISRIVHDASRLSKCRFAQVILAAPDVDTNVFADLARNFEQVAKGATLYVSDKDVLLEASSWLHDYPRAGIRPPVTVVPNIDTIDVGRIDLSLLGHSYFGGVRDVLHDMHRLIHSDALPKKRMGLAEVLEPGGARYWTIRA